MTLRQLLLAAEEDVGAQDDWVDHGDGRRVTWPVFEGNLTRTFEDLFCPDARVKAQLQLIFDNVEQPYPGKWKHQYNKIIKSSGKLSHIQIS